LTALVLLPVVNYFLYRIALFDLRPPYLARFAQPKGQVPSEAIFRFTVVLSLPFLLSAFVAFLLPLITQPESDTGKDLIMLAILGVFWMALSVFGTLLPAVAARQPLSPRAALDAARGRWTGVAIQLFLVAGVMGATILIATTVGKYRLNELQAAPPFHYTVDILLNAFGWASQVPTVVILTRAYRQGWPQGTGVAANPA
jgi:hypothetical protein